MYKVPSQNNTLHTQKLTFGLPWDSDLRNILFPRFIIFNSLISSRAAVQRWGVRGQPGSDRLISRWEIRQKNLIPSRQEAPVLDYIQRIFQNCAISGVGFILPSSPPRLMCHLFVDEVVTCGEESPGPHLPWGIERHMTRTGETAAVSLPSWPILRKWIFPYAHFSVKEVQF